MRGGPEIAAIKAEYERAKIALADAVTERDKQRAAIRYVAALIMAQMPILDYDESIVVTHERVAKAVAALHLPCHLHDLNGCGMGC